MFQDEKHLAAALEFARWELADAEKELKLLKSVASASEKEYSKIQKDVKLLKRNWIVKGIFLSWSSDQVWIWHRFF